MNYRNTETGEIISENCYYKLSLNKRDPYVQCYAKPTHEVDESSDLLTTLIIAETLIDSSNSFDTNSNNDTSSFDSTPDIPSTDFGGGDFGGGGASGDY
jgi:uncharacterized membrane protein YgcG